MRSTDDNVCERCGGWGWTGNTCPRCEIREQQAAGNTLRKVPAPVPETISPRVYLAGQALAGLITQTLPHEYSDEEVSALGELAVDIADATLDAMTWPSGKPEGKR